MYTIRGHPLGVLSKKENQKNSLSTGKHTQEQSMDEFR